MADVQSSSQVDETAGSRDFSRLMLGSRKFEEVGTIRTQRTTATPWRVALAELLPMLAQKLMGASEGFTTGWQLRRQGTLHTFVHR